MYTRPLENKTPRLENSQKFLKITVWALLEKASLDTLTTRIWQKAGRSHEGNLGTKVLNFLKHKLGNGYSEQTFEEK